MSEPRMVSTTDEVFVSELAERVARGSPVAVEEWQLLERIGDRIELASLDCGFPEEWRWE